MRRLTLADIDGCVEVSKDREWDTTREQWAMLLRFGFGFGFDDAGELCGTVTIFPYEGVSFVGMLLVRRRVERQGWARRLMEFALDETRSNAAALYATTFGYPLYKKMGFAEAEMLCTYRGRWSGERVDGIALRAPSSLSRDEKAALIVADARAFGTARPQVIDGMCSVASTVATMKHHDGLSFAIVREKDAAAHIGPVVASDDATAFAMISSLASQSAETIVHVGADKTALRKHLTESGLALTRELPLMTRGFVPPRGSSWYAVATKGTG